MSDSEVHEEKDLRQQVLETAPKVWGFDGQMLALAEECSELSAQVVRYANLKSADLSGIIEELVDTEMMIDQMKWYFKKDPLLQNLYLHHKAHKERRTLDRANKFLKAHGTKVELDEQTLAHLRSPSVA